MRLIDADNITGAKFHDLPYTHIVPRDVESESYMLGWNDAIDAIVEVEPTIDAVEVIRCKDCIHSSVLLDEYDNECGYACHKTHDAAGFWLEVEKDHFCGYGERGEADE